MDTTEKRAAYNCNATQINENNSINDNFSIYPNPSHSDINIVLQSTEKFQIEITNSTSQLVLKELNQNKIDLSNYSNGLYIISVKQGQKIYTQKLNKQ